MNMAGERDKESPACLCLLFGFPWLQYGNKDSYDQYQDLQRAKYQVHPLIVEVSGISQRCQADFTGDLHHGCFPGYEEKGSEQNRSDRYNPFEGEPIVFEEPPFAEHGVE